jgi:hypothetical protein
MFQDMYHEATRHIPGYDNSPSSVYVDTDSLDTSCLNVLFMRDELFRGAQLGEMQVETFRFKYNIARECTVGKKCAFWEANGISGMPCLVQSRILGKKVYFLFCMCCGGCTRKAKGQDKKSKVILERLTLRHIHILQDYHRVEGGRRFKKNLRALPNDAVSQLTPQHMRHLREVDYDWIYQPLAIPACILNDKSDVVWTWDDHLRHCNREEHRAEFAKPVETTRTSLKVTLVTSHSKNESWTIRPQFITRRLMQVQDKNLIQCVTCRHFLPAYMNMERRLERFGF